MQTLLEFLVYLILLRKLPFVNFGLKAAYNRNTIVVWIMIKLLACNGLLIGLSGAGDYDTTDFVVERTSFSYWQSEGSLF